MNDLQANNFAEFFHALYGHEPFPWQQMLLERVVNPQFGWPDLIDLPTASGKTACIDIAVFALAMGASTPRRIWFVVDRRIVVDEAYKRAAAMAQKLKSAKDGILQTVANRLLKLGGMLEKPLAVGRLRGGAPRDIAWAGNPAQPAVLTSTIDQLGSRLLFRAYGASKHMWPIHAALAGNDSLIILDEAHLAQPFLQTVHAIQRFRKQPWAKEMLSTPFELVVMSATLPEGSANAIRFPASEEERAKALKHLRLEQRMAAPKPTELRIAKASKDMKGKNTDDLVLDAIGQAKKYVSLNRRRIAIMVNRVSTAREITRMLKELVADARVELLTGRIRPVDREKLISDISPLLKSDSKENSEQPMILVTTQCLEVGADFSFDALISECASIDALRQRFGRLSRLGEFREASGVILVRGSDVRAEEKLDDDKPLDPVYANALARTWNWLTGGGATSIAMGINALELKINALTPLESVKLIGPRRDAPTLLPAYLDLWSQTNPRPSIEADVALFLHGVPPPNEKPRADVYVMWRKDLDIADEQQLDTKEKLALIENLLPLPGEMMQMPIRELRQRLSPGIQKNIVDADLEGLFELESANEDSAEPGQISAVLWRVGEASELYDLRQLQPRDVVIFPATSDTFLKLNDAAKLLPDVYEQAYKLRFGIERQLVHVTEDDLQEDEPKEVVLLRLDTQRFDHDPKLGNYGPGFYWATAKQKETPLDVWLSDDDEDETLYTGNALSLEDHTRHVQKAVGALAEKLNLDELLHKALIRTAELHDIGKSDPRFQCVLRHGKFDDGRILAKSRFRLPRDKEKMLYAFSKLPDGFRHEFLSTQMAELLIKLADQYRELILHLTASHHGHCRPLANVIIDDNFPDAKCSISDIPYTITSDQRSKLPVHRLDSGVAERFWKLTRHYGWWGLAYLEAILRCADMHASAFAEEVQ